MITKDSIHCPICGKEIYLNELEGSDGAVYADKEHFVDCSICKTLDIAVKLCDVVTEPNLDIEEEDRSEDDELICGFWAKTFLTPASMVEGLRTFNFVFD